MKKFLVIKDHKFVTPDVEASFESMEDARQYAELCKLRDNGVYVIAQLI